MAGIPRILPLVAVAIGGVLAVNALRGAPNLIGAAKSFAEDAVGTKATPAVTPGQSILGGPAPTAPPTPAPVCAPTAAELAKEAGLSPAELQVLQSLGDRRGELDQREEGLDTQVQLIAAAEAKLDDRIKDMNSLKQNIQDLLGQADAESQAETDRLVTVYEKMKPKDAAARMTLLDDSVRLPIAAKMKPAILAAILGFMQPEDAKVLTEKLAQRVKGSAAITGAQTALNPPAATPPTATPPPATAQNNPATAPATASAAKDQTAPAAKPIRTARAKPRPKPKAAPKTDVAANAKSAAAAAGDTSTKTAAAAPASSSASKPAAGATTPSSTPAKTG